VSLFERATEDFSFFGNQSVTDCTGSGKGLPTEIAAIRSMSHEGEKPGFVPLRGRRFGSATGCASGLRGRATVKLNSSGCGSSSSQGTKAQVAMTNMSLKRLVERGYGTKPCSGDGPGLDG
jgi:hypothetical protein